VRGIFFLGLRLDEQLNLSSPSDSEIAAIDSSVRVLLYAALVSGPSAGKSHERLAL
jgi:hypothetical protein